MEVNMINLGEISLENIRNGNSAYKRVLVKQGEVKNSGMVFMNEAYLPVGEETSLHTHDDLEEIMYVTSGYGKLVLGKSETAIKKGDRIIIPQKCGHSVKNTGCGMLKFICFGMKTA